MEEIKDTKERIAYNARLLFDKHGFHGTSLRDLCELSGCKMPTIYYHFGNKENLFYEVVCVAFEELLKKLWAQLPKDVSVKEFDTLLIIQKKHLSEEERLIYRLAMKMWLGFDSCEIGRQKLKEWRDGFHEKTLIKHSEIVSSLQWAKFIARSITYLIQLIILTGEDIPDDEIREEIDRIFNVATHENINKI